MWLDLLATACGFWEYVADPQEAIRRANPAVIQAQPPCPQSYTNKPKLWNPSRVWKQIKWTSNQNQIMKIGHNSMKKSNCTYIGPKDSFLWTDVWGNLLLGENLKTSQKDVEDRFTYSSWLKIIVIFKPVCFLYFNRILDVWHYNNKVLLLQTWFSISLN